MARRLFDFLFVEISVAVGKRVPRYGLWLTLHDLGWNPEALSPASALAFCEGPLEPFLIDRGFTLSHRARRRLCKVIARFDPNVPTAYERFEAFHRRLG